MAPGSPSWHSRSPVQANFSDKHVSGSMSRTTIGQPYLDTFAE
jgi:hypothetical protein